jgi:hypothetical protein
MHVSVQKNGRMFHLAAEATWTCGCSKKSLDALKVDLGSLLDHGK